jgi:hypothetical protein
MLKTRLGPEGDRRSEVEQSRDFEVVAGLAACERHDARALLRGATDAEIANVRAPLQAASPSMNPPLRSDSN